MFYSPYFAYGFIPDSAQYATCKIRGFKMALFPGKEKLPHIFSMMRMFEF